MSQHGVHVCWQDGGSALLSMTKILLTGNSRKPDTLQRTFYLHKQHRNREKKPSRIEMLLKEKYSKNKMFKILDKLKKCNILQLI